MIVHRSEGCVGTTSIGLPAPTRLNSSKDCTLTPWLLSACSTTSMWPFQLSCSLRTCEMIVHRSAGCVGTTSTGLPAHNLLNSSKDCTLTPWLLSACSTTRIWLMQLLCGLKGSEMIVHRSDSCVGTTSAFAHIRLPEVAERLHADALAAQCLQHNTHLADVAVAVSEES